MYMDTEAASSVTSTDHLSPPSTISRLSDSDMSEFDFEDGVVGMKSDRRQGGADHASLSSLGSSCSPPFLTDDVLDPLDRRPHRDTSPQRRGRLPTVVRREDVTSSYHHHIPRKDIVDRMPVAEQDSHMVRPRSRSAAPSDVPSIHSHRSRSKSPRWGMSETISRSLSPPETRQSILLILF